MSIEFFRRAVLPGVLLGFLAFWLTVAPAQAQLLPAGFFDNAPVPGQGAAAIEADRMALDSRTGVISAEGGVVLRYDGYTIHADRIEYDRETSAVKAVGNVTISDPQNNTYTADSIEVTGGMKEAFLNSLTLTTVEGAVITAKDAHYSSELATILTDASYSPCGLCIDSKGRTIGWKVKAARIIYDRRNASVTLEQPSLALLGMPVAWLPWFWVPDPTQPRAGGLRMPSVDYDPQRGLGLTVPYFVPAGEDLDILISPKLMSRQGLMLIGDLNWRLPNYGEIEVKASGLYQLDKSAYAGTVGYRDWRGAIQTTGAFRPAKDWVVGWSYSAFTDNAYLTDYDFTDADSETNEAYATYLTSSTYLDARVQSFNLYGAHVDTNDPAQGMALPVTRFEHVQDLAQGWGRLHLTGELLSVVRGDDQTATYDTTDYVFGYKGAKQHLMLEGGWEDQYILPGGFAATPYLGLRADVAHYDGASGLASAPSDSLLLSATPIAAMDVRWPLMAVNGDDTHLLEPIAQLVYRGSSTTDVGITNDDAQSFVFDTSNLFSYNRFSGIDRQETGLRANLGAHYEANFANGSWLDLIAGESFHLLGTNALGISDDAQTGTSTGLASTASYIVAGATGGFSNGLSGGAKVQIDPATPRITRAGVGIDYSPGNRWNFGSDYIYVAKDTALGTTEDQHEIVGRVGVPVADYWTVNGSLTYNLATNGWIKATTGVTYDDNYLLLGADTNFTPTSWGFGVHFGLKGPNGGVAF